MFFYCNDDKQTEGAEVVDYRTLNAPATTRSPSDRVTRAGNSSWALVPVPSALVATARLLFSLAGVGSSSSMNDTSTTTGLEALEIRERWFSCEDFQEF